MKTFALGALFGAVLAMTVAVVVAMTTSVGQRFLTPANSAAGGASHPSDLQPPSFPAQTTPVRTWQVRDLSGREADLGDFPQKVLFVNRWATWCAPCVVEMPEIEKLAERLADEDVAFLIVSDEAPDTVIPFVQEKRWRLPVYTASETPPMLQTDVIPATFVLDHARRIVFKHIGIARWDDETSLAFIDNLLRSTP